MASVWDTGLGSLSFLSQAGVTKIMMRKQVEERLMKKHVVYPSLFAKPHSSAGSPLALSTPSVTLVGVFPVFI